MAGGETLERIFVDNLARGMSEQIPPTAMAKDAQGPLWRLLKNLRPHDGELFREAAMDSIRTKLGDSLVGHTPPTGALDSTDNNVQSPMIVKTYLEGEYILVVTTQQIWWYIASTDNWVSLNPEYDESSEDTAADEQIDAAAGGLVFDNAAAGLLFRTRNICPGMYVILDPAGDDAGPVTRVIDAVGSETQFTVAGADTGFGAGDLIDFKIVRTFRNDYHFPMFADVFNGNLYVTGKVAPSGYAATSAPAPGVVKVTDVYRSTVTGQDAVFLMGAGTLHAETEVNTGGDNPKFYQATNLTEILGMEFLGDSRMVLATWEDDAAGANLNRVRYSDHSDNEEWDPAATSSTAGWSDRTEFSNRMTAIGRFGNSLTFHFPEGIVWGHPTGEQSPPLSYQPAVGVHQGCVLTRSLQSLPVGQVFVGTDHQIQLFDGSKVTEIGFDIREQIAENWGYTPFIHSGIDWYRNEYSLYVLDVNPTNIQPGRGWGGFRTWKIGRAKVKTVVAEDATTIQLVWNWQNRQWRERMWDGAVTAVSNICRNNPGTTWTNRLDGQALIGVPSITGLNWLDGESAVGAAQLATDVIYRLRQEPTSYTDIDPNGTTASFLNNGFDTQGCVAISDDLDAQIPGVYKYWRYVQLWLGRYLLTSGLTQTIVVSLSADEGASWTDETVVGAGGTNTPSEFIVPFFFDTICAQKIRVKIAIAAAPHLLCSIRKMAVWYQIAGQVDGNYDTPGSLSGDVLT